MCSHAARVVQPGDTIVAMQTHGCRCNATIPTHQCDCVDVRSHSNEHKKRWILGKSYYTSKEQQALIMSDVAVYSATEASMASLISAILSEYVYADECTITDGTACMGTNTIPFARAFKHVNAVELDERQCEDLVDNMQTMQIMRGCKNVRVYNMGIGSDDALIFLQHDVLYLGPPWGGG